MGASIGLHDGCGCLDRKRAAESALTGLVLTEADRDKISKISQEIGRAVEEKRAALARCDRLDKENLALREANARLEEALAAASGTPRGCQGGTSSPRCPDGHRQPELVPER
ncbi:unnamed protein product [Prorocentrum cordatum]|uniref:Uncharacterized protein n=1 Tax=Prorocentrum cordatum TaxID=2364126 RepID=A0ABN9RUB1_9DINO|nr:unnamed protein product [Polarella glacialis]